MPKNKGISGEQWSECDRCGFPHPIGLLSKQLGLKLCNCHGCLDNLLVQRRPQLIADALEGTTEFQDQVGVQLEDPGEILFE